MIFPYITVSNLAAWKPSICPSICGPGDDCDRPIRSNLLRVAHVCRDVPLKCVSLTSAGKIFENINIDLKLKPAVKTRRLRQITKACIPLSLASIAISAYICSSSKNAINEMNECHSSVLFDSFMCAGLYFTCRDLFWCRKPTFGRQIKSVSLNSSINMASVFFTYFS
jgi:hypothetical protein